MSKQKKQYQPGRQIEQQSIISASETHLHSGPLPSPETLAQYEHIVPGLAERIISMAENEAEARRENERNSIRHIIIISYLGIVFAFISVLIISLLVWYAISKGFDAVAGTIAVGCIAAVAGVFVFFRKSTKREL